MSPLPPSVRTSGTPLRAARLMGAAVALGLLAAAMWFAWLGWDDDYYLTKGVEEGPYRAWQVVGCGLCVAALAVAAQLWARGFVAVPLLAAAAMVGFAVPWTVHATANDDSGLFVVGLLFLLVGGGTALVVLLAVTESVASAVRRRR